MEKKTASDMRAYLSSFEPEYPVKKGYIARLIVNDKLANGDICRMVKGLVQTAEPDRQINEARVRTCVCELRRHAARKVNYTMAWADLVKFNQQSFPVSFRPGESPSLPPVTSAPHIIRPDHTCAQVVQSENSSAPHIIQSDHTCALVVQSENSSAPHIIQPDHTCALVVQSENSSAPHIIQPDHTCALVIQTDHAQHTSATPWVDELPFDSIHNESLSVPILPRSLSPKRLKKDCDNCVAKQRTSLNMLKDNRNLRLQIRALRTRLREEKKQMSLKTLTVTIKRTSESAELWRAKHSHLKKQFKEQEVRHRAQEILIRNTHEEEIRALTSTNVELEWKLQKSEENYIDLENRNKPSKEEFFQIE